MEIIPLSDGENMTGYAVANWKSHKTETEAVAWIGEFLRLYKPSPNLRVIVAPPTPYIFTLRRMLVKADVVGLSLACQDLSPFPFGSYTGEVAAAMITGQVEYCLVGHPERRRYFNENNQQVANKASEALAASITPILCLDSPYSRAQLAALPNLDRRVLIAYVPKQPVGGEFSQTLVRAGQGVAELHGLLDDRAIIYGGPLRAADAASYMKLPAVDGLMASTASLDPSEFAAICEAVVTAKL